MRRFVYTFMAMVAIFDLVSAAAPPSDPRITGNVQQLTPLIVERTGKILEGFELDEIFFLANEQDDSRSGFAVEYDLSNLDQPALPLARLQLKNVAKVPVKRPGAKTSAERGAIHVRAPRVPGGPPVIVASVPIKPGHEATYVLDVTDAVNAVLASKAGPKKLRLEVSAAGKPLPYEVYGTREIPLLDLTFDSAWSDDSLARVEPITRGPTVYREAALPLVEDREADAIVRLLYPARRIVEVVRNLTGETLKAGKDYELRDGDLVLKAGSPAIQFAPDFFAVERKDKDGKTTVARNAVQLQEGTWYQERQIEVTYEPAARELQLPPALSSLADLPRTKQRLESKQPLTVILFGDSISAGGNASKFQGGRPWQPSYGDLVVRKVREHYQAPIAYYNHSRGGATSAYALTQAESQVTWFKPDLVILAYGMNDRSDERRPLHRENLEKIIDGVRAESPETEFVIVTSMMNNPRQPSGNGPIFFIRDEGLKIRRPGIAFADVTSTHEKMLERKAYLDTSGNGANHPNDFLQRVYAMRVLEVLLPPTP